MYVLDPAGRGARIPTSMGWMRAMRGTPTCAFVVRRSELSGDERPTDGEPRIARTSVAQGEHFFGIRKDCMEENKLLRVPS